MLGGQAAHDAWAEWPAAQLLQLLVTLAYAHCPTGCPLAIMDRLDVQQRQYLFRKYREFSTRVCHSGSRRAWRCAGSMKVA